MSSARKIHMLLIAAVAAAQLGCSGDALKQATLAEGRGVEPDLVFGKTTVTQARGTLGSRAGEPSTTAHVTTVEAGPLRLIFVPPDTGGEAVLHAIRTARIPNPQYPRWDGKTARGIGFLDSEDQVRAAYGAPAAEWWRSAGGRALYYTNGVVFIVEHPSNITGYDGPAPTPTSANVTELWVTAPFEIIEAPQPIESGQLRVTTPPRTTLRIVL